MTRRVPLVAALLASALLAFSCTSEAPPTRVDSPAPIALVPLSSGIEARLQAVSTATSQVIWASGLEGTVIRSIDGGRNWSRSTVGDPELQLRDIHALDERRAWVLAAGEGDASRILYTEDGGASWTEQARNPDAEGFWDCFAFLDDHRAILLGDAVGGRLSIWRTVDGENWLRLERPPEAQPGEGAFAASGDCVAIGLGETILAVTGNAERARLLYSTDVGESWEIVDTDAPAGEAAGLTAVAARRPRDSSSGAPPPVLDVIVVGGNIAEPDTSQPVIRRLSSSGASTPSLAPPPLVGPLYGVAWLQDSVVAVGPGGAALSLDSGVSWQTLSARAWWSVTFGSADGTLAWLVGPQGGLARLDLPPRAP